MKKTQILDLPVLKDVVVPGKEIPLTDELSPGLDERQLKTLQQQIEKIIQTQFDEILKKVSQDTIKKINAHLDKVLPKLLEHMNQSVSDENNEDDDDE
ncbi:hypothetical protein THII_1309 [Thioploca ingrica]|uniref:Uncharacterized protein n=1 Tax=Thioploca ingrica TaxID=40754 RepID=A0A090BUS3_9GAMM|nr:hypothetical protein THII_1309 [Thioploca ingrica]